MKIVVSVLLFLVVTANVFAQEKKLYDPTANAKKDIAAIIQKAKAEKKHVLIQVGGNWCKWCVEFARFCKADMSIDSVLNTSFVWYHLNYSKENKNKPVLAKYQFPQRFGFPVFLILNEKGELIHTQNSEYLEDGGKSYDKKKVLAFLKMWSKSALDPANYAD